MSFEIWTDGGCNRETRIGGYGVVILEDGKQIDEFRAGYANTTTNRMELMAVIAALEKIPEGSTAKLTSDSLYVINNISSIPRWSRNGWISNYQGVQKPVANQDLWRKLQVLLEKRTVFPRWVKGHSGDKNNERADTLATKAARYDAKKVDQDQPENAAPEAISSPAQWESDL